jgi:hypothetical protein
MKGHSVWSTQQCQIFALLFNGRKALRGAPKITLTPPDCASQMAVMSILTNPRRFPCPKSHWKNSRKERPEIFSIPSDG